MKTELKDYLPLYIGQEVQRRGNLAGDYEVAKLVGFCKSEVEEGKLIAQVDTGDEEEHYYHEWYVEEVILFLRPLSDMKEEEFQEFAKLFFKTEKLTFATLRNVWYAANRELDPEYEGEVMEYINEAGDDDPENVVMCDSRTKSITYGWLSYDETYHSFSTNEQAEVTRYLLSRGFDLFGLIESGLAIDKTTLK